MPAAADGAREVGGEEERSTACRRWNDGGRSVQAQLLFCCETERLAEWPESYRPAGTSGNSERMALLSMTTYRSLVVWRDQRADGKV